jgi:thiamine transporter
MANKNVLFLVEVAIFSALAMLLDIFSSMLSLKIWPQGGSISIAMVPVFLLAFRWGIKGGLLSGLLLGALQIITGQAYIFTPVQAFLDYIAAFTVLGLAGLTASQVVNSVKTRSKGKLITFVVIGTLIGSLLRFLAHFVGGIVFFGQYAPEGTPVWLYSLLYNGSYMVPGFIVSAIIIVILFSTSPRLVIPRSK